MTRLSVNSGSCAFLSKSKGSGLGPVIGSEVGSSGGEAVTQLGDVGGGASLRRAY